MKMRFAGAASVLFLMSACAPDEMSVPVDVAAITQADADAALDAGGALSIDFSDVAVDRVDFVDGNYIFTGLRSADDSVGVPMRIDRAIVTAPYLDEAGDLRFERLRIEGVDFPDPTGAMVMTADAVEIIRPSARLIAEIMEDARLGRDSFRPGAMMDWGFEVLRIENWSQSSPHDAKGEMAIAIGEMEWRNERSSNLASGVIRDMVVDISGAKDENGQFELDEIRIEGLDIGTMEETLRRGGGVMGENTAPDLMAAFSDPEQAPRFVAVTGARGDMAEGRIVLDEYSLTTERDGDLINQQFLMGGVEMVFPEDDPEMAEMFALLSSVGQDSFDFTLAANTQYDTTTGRLVSHGDTYLDFPGLLRLEAEFSIAEYDEYVRASSWGSASDSRLQRAAQGAADNPLVPFMPLVVESLTLRATDGGVMDAAFAMAAEQEGLDPVNMRTQASLMVSMAPGSIPDIIPSKDALDVGAALSSFVMHGGTLELQLDPAEDRALAQYMMALGAGEVLWDELGVSLTHIE